MKTYLYKFIPLLIFVIGLTIFCIFNDYPTLIHVVAIIVFVTNGLKNVCFVNSNIRDHMIWMSPKLDRILGMISGVLYLGICVVGSIRQQPLWIVILILVSTVGTTVLLETKLHITLLQLEETLSSERVKREVISRHKAQHLKHIFFTVIIAVIISIFIPLYLKLMVIFGFAIMILVLTSISVAIFGKYFTITENMQTIIRIFKMISVDVIANIL